MDWFRWHHGSVTDPKWRVVANRAMVRVADVVAVWAMMLEAASANKEDRGVIAGWDDEDAAACLGMEAGQVTAIRVAMQGKTLDGLSVTGWSKRQPKRERDEEGASTERSRRSREAKAVADHATPCNATQRPREEKKKEEETKSLHHPQSALALADQIEELAGADRSKSRRWATAAKLVAEWLGRGADPETHILEGVRVTMESRKDPSPPEGPEYFWPAIQKLMTAPEYVAVPGKKRPGNGGVVVGAFDSGTPYSRAWKAWRENGKEGPEPCREDFEPKRGVA